MADQSLFPRLVLAKSDHATKRGQLDKTDPSGSVLFCLAILDALPGAVPVADFLDRIAAEAMHAVVSEN
jgi:hypothetical protein